MGHEVDLTDDVRELLRHLIDLRTTKDTDTRSWRTGWKAWQIGSFMSNVNRILRWSANEHGEEYEILRHIKQIVRRGWNEHAGWIGASEKEIEGIFARVEAVLSRGDI